MHISLKKFTALTLTGILTLSPITTVQAQEPAHPFAVTTQTAMATAEQLLDALSIAGLTVAVVDIDSGFRWLQGFGYSHVYEQVPVTADTLFNIGSVAKVFTAVAIMQLVEAGKLDLDEPIVTYLPEFSLLPNPVHGGDSNNITTRMLLSHVSGIHDFHGDTFFVTDGSGQDRYFSNRLLDHLSRLHMQNEEVNRITYSNTGFGILGILVSRLTGAHNYFDGFVSHTDTNIFAPLGMTNSSFAITDSNRAYIANPYSDATTPIDHFIYVSDTAAGGMVSTATDMATFMEAMLTDGAGILTAQTISEMATVQDWGIAVPAAMEFGLGIFHLTQADGSVLVGHGGNLQHHSNMILDFNNGIGVFVSGNSVGASAGSIMLSSSIWQAAVLEKTGIPVVAIDPTATPYEPSEVTLTRQEMEALTGWYTLLDQLIISDEGVLTFPQVPGLPTPLELIPMSDGTFATDFGSFSFREYDGTLFVFQGHIEAGERINVSPASSDFAQWLGTYYDSNGEPGLTVDINEYGLIAMNYPDLGDIIFIANYLGDGMVHFPGKMSRFGSVGQFRLEDGVAVFYYSGMVLTRLDTE